MLEAAWERMRQSSSALKEKGTAPPEPGASRPTCRFPCPEDCAMVWGIMSSTPAPNIVLFDSDCPLCTFQMKSLTWLDWFHRVAFIPIADARSARVAPDLTREDLMEAIHCVTPEGEIHRGARAIRFLGWRLPLLVPVSLALSLPGVIWVAERFYQWVSKNRLLLSRIFGCKGACALMPERPREPEKRAD